MLHGTPSKKDFLDQVKKLREIDQIEEEGEETATDHDLQHYTSTPKEPIVVDKENIVSLNSRRETNERSIFRKSPRTNRVRSK